jgi:hypothetical protein
MKQLIEDLISALEYHVEQTRPIYSTTVALQAAREALKALQPQRTWVGLTDEEIFDVWLNETPAPDKVFYQKLCRSIEFKLRSKNYD